jgi:tetratricopeptide (TPR) repeat protein
MIYLYHAQGLGKHDLAKSDFKDAIKWNPSNYMAYIELARVYSDLGFTAQATSIINQLLDLKPGAEILKEAQDELSKLKRTPGNN